MAKRSIQTDDASGTTIGTRFPRTQHSRRDDGRAAPSRTRIILPAPSLSPGRPRSLSHSLSLTIFTLSGRSALVRRLSRQLSSINRQTPSRRHERRAADPVRNIKLRVEPQVSRGVGRPEVARYGTIAPVLYFELRKTLPRSTFRWLSSFYIL